jgi:Uma2 family endonuclease
MCPPDLVKVVSESDRWGHVMHKVEEFLNAGVLEVWVVDPDGEFVEVFRTDSRPRRIVREGLIDSPTLLPGFSCSVSNFFPLY